MQRLVIFASRTGSNAGAIIRHFRRTGTAEVSLILSSRPDAGVLDLARREGILSTVAGKSRLDTEEVLTEITDAGADLIVLAGFLLKVPDRFIAAFPGRIINIHPALLPAFGGHGMYGRRVHEAVLGAGVPQSGITIHRVDEQYDHGEILLQARCPVLPLDTPESLAARVQGLEHYYYPLVLERLLTEQ
jgi:phosphoribosylglycinamide formyltransferase 1